MLRSRGAGPLRCGRGCRRDYPASSMWPELGFVAQGDLVGRGAGGDRLTVWWRDHGHADLMTWAGAPASVTPVILDANVFIDLHCDDAGDQRHKSRELLLDALAGRVELLVTPELGNEINRQVDDVERARLQSIRQSYPTIPATAAVVAQNRAALIAELSYEPSGQRDKSDVAHVVYAASVGVQVVVTRDETAQRRLRTAARDVLGVALVSPQELVVLLDEADTAESYSPFALLGTGFQVREAATADKSLIDGFLDTGAGERRSEFNRRVRALAEHRTAGAHRLVFITPTGEAVALLGTDLVNGVLDVSILRMKAFPLSGTMAAQLASRLRPLAREAGVCAIRASDPHPNPLLVEALLADGFGGATRGPVGLSIAATCTVTDVAARVRSAAQALNDDERVALAGVLSLADSIQTQNVPDGGGRHRAAASPASRCGRAARHVASADQGGMGEPTVRHPTRHLRAGRPSWHQRRTRLLPRRSLRRNCPRTRALVRQRRRPYERHWVQRVDRGPRWHTERATSNLSASRRLRLQRGQLGGWQEWSSQSLAGDQHRAVSIDHAPRAASSSRYPGGSDPAASLALADHRRAFRQDRDGGTPMTGGVSSSADRVMVLSIHPRHVEKILEGTKSVELRRTRPLVTPGQPVAIYATLPSGALVATCRISEVHAGTPASIWQLVGDDTGVTRAEFEVYFKGADSAVALRLDTVTALVGQISLQQLRAQGRSFHPPQTWHFLDRQRLVQLLGMHPSSAALTGLLPATG